MKILQIIVGALLAGSTGFLAVAAVLALSGAIEADRDLAVAMNLVLILFLAGDLLARLIVPRMIVDQGRRKIAAGNWSLPGGAAETEMAALIERTGDAGRLLVLYQTKTIVAAALMEGIAFFAIIVFLITRSTVGLVVAISMILGLALHMPSRSGVVHWIEDQLHLIRQENQLG
ncbi:MAG: hypothetical protein GXY83_27660 [Rhodopirellula sp.]|nr:hypothetical protein [Rhodopirellula sp.]